MLDLLFGIQGPVCPSPIFFVLLLFNCKQQLDKQIKVPTFKIVSVEQVHNKLIELDVLWRGSQYIKFY